MKNYVQKGDVLTLTAPANVTGGQGLMVGDLFGVVAGDALNGEQFDLHVVGVFDLPAETADTFSVGQIVFWNRVSGKVTEAESESDDVIGHAVAVKGSGATAARVRIG